MTSSNRPFLLHPFPTFRPLSKAGHTLRHALCRGVWAGGRKVGGDAGRGDGPAAWRRGVRRRAAPGATGSQAVPERIRAHPARARPRRAVRRWRGAREARSLPPALTRPCWSGASAACLRVCPVSSGSMPVTAGPVLATRCYYLAIHVTRHGRRGRPVTALPAMGCQTCQTR